VTGIDIAPPMITAARQRVTAPEIEWIVGDAATYDFAPKTYDAVISRFGVMFFTDPAVAFRNLGAATRPGGRLIVTVWSQLHATGIFGIPYTVATTTLHRLGWSTKAFRRTECCSAWVGPSDFARYSPRLDGPTST
jgi:ubiquinone/menaquinone biosynthesis C-methylase UbiE